MPKNSLELLEGVTSWTNGNCYLKKTLSKIVCILKYIGD